jgi:UPF0755 protein
MRRILTILLFLTLAVGLSVLGIRVLADHDFGPPSARLTLPQRIQYSAKVLWADGLLIRPLNAAAPEVDFEVLPGESVTSVCERLEGAGIVVDGAMLRDYLIYTGQDTSLQAGRHRVSAAMSMIDVARQMQDATPTDVEFVVLAGWRIEEIAALLPTSGLSITPEEFVRTASTPRSGYSFLSGAASNEGFLYPDSYVLPRTTPPDGFVDALVRNFSQHLNSDLQAGFSAQGLSVYEAVTLASIVERESVRMEEAPLIASVYLNRLRGGMQLEADPTVQYALGFDATRQTWWTNPLSLADLKFPSPFNTYLVTGLPPAPIANPGEGALASVAAPMLSPYYYFSARCDGSGFHNFASTFDEHLANLCP